MFYLNVPHNRRLVFYLAAEEYLSEHCSEGCFFTWQTRPTVIFGRHQVMANEVNIPYCEKHGIEMYRRKSGGGCVYSDEGNLMMSFISPSYHSQQVFDTFLQQLVQALSALGLPAVSTTHNDVLVEGRKVSGNACFALPTGTIVHGTLLLSSNIEVLQQTITPSTEKLQKNGVQSVRQRVATLSELGIHDATTVIRQLQTTFCTNGLVRELTPDDIGAIERIEQTYLQPDFLYGK